MSVRKPKRPPKKDGKRRRPNVKPTAEAKKLDAAYRQAAERDERAGIGLPNHAKQPPAERSAPPE